VDLFRGKFKGIKKLLWKQAVVKTYPLEWPGSRP
jgi:hypothetical protein